METILAKRRRELKEQRRQRALKRLEEAVRFLYRCGAISVYVFGSVLKEGYFDEHSDVDIAVSGIPEELKIISYRALENIFKDIPFDLLFLDEPLRPEIRKRIEKEGILWKPS